MNYRIQQIKKFRKRNRDTIRIVDFAIALSDERCNRERHRDPMVAARINLCSTQSDWTIHAQSIIEFFHFAAHGSKSRHGRGDAVGFFHAQFFRIANLDAALDLRADDRQQRRVEQRPTCRWEIQTPI